MALSAAAARTELTALVAAAPHPFPLDRAALLLAVDAYPGLDFAPYEQRLDDFAAQVARSCPASGAADPRVRLGAMRRVLFEEAGFHGNRGEYYDVRNSYLNEVLDRKLGIPISLSAVVLGVAHRLGWPMEGVSFPGHFLVRYEHADAPLAIDPFHGGLILGRDELEERWRLATGVPAPGLRQMLTPAAPSTILVRMLNNIWMVHRHEGQFAAAAQAAEKIVLVEPQNPLHARTAGLLWLEAGEPQRAERYLRAYVEAAPHAPDAESVRDRLARLAEHFPAEPPPPPGSAGEGFPPPPPLI